MSDFIIDKLTNLLAVKRQYEKSGDNYKKLKYGVSVFVYNVSKTILLIIVSLILGIFPYVLAFAAVYGLIRTFAGGIHFQSNTLCTVIGFIYYLAGVYTSLYIKIPLANAIILHVICFVIYMKYAPSPTKGRPIGPNQHKRFKALTILILAIVFVLLCVTGENVYRNIVLAAVFAEMLNILPITYKLCHEERR